MSSGFHVDWTFGLLDFHLTRIAIRDPGFPDLPLNRESHGKYGLQDPLHDQLRKVRQVPSLSFVQKPSSEPWINRFGLGTLDQLILKFMKDQDATLVA